jgi:hypothetical protein
MYEPDYNKQFVFETYEEAMEAWMALPAELQEIISSPRQSHHCWIFDKEPEEWQ